MSDQYSVAQLKQALVDVSKVVDGTLSQRKYNDNRGESRPHSATIHRRAGWNRLKTEMGLDTELPRDDPSNVGHRFAPSSRHDTVGSEYEVVQTRLGDNERANIAVHRLVAVAKYGYDRVVENVVHHENRHGLDNRPANLELMTKEDHSAMHAEQIERDENQNFAEVDE